MPLAEVLHAQAGGMADAVDRAQHRVGAFDQIVDALQRLLLAAVVVDQAGLPPLGHVAQMRDQPRSAADVEQAAGASR